MVPGSPSPADTYGNEGGIDGIRRNHLRWRRRQGGRSGWCAHGEILPVSSLLTSPPSSVIRVLEPPDTPEDAAIGVTETPDKRDDSAIGLPEWLRAGIGPHFE